MAVPPYTIGERMTVIQRIVGHDCVINVGEEVAVSYVGECLGQKMLGVKTDDGREALGMNNIPDEFFIR